MRRSGLAAAGRTLGAAAAERPAALRPNPVRGDLGDGTYLNPILGGDHADPGAIRVGKDYYLTHSSFEYAPGLLIWHSRDLVNWELAGAGLKRYYGNVWAPYLCEHRGLYYIYYPCEGRLHVIHAASPSGPWSDPVALNIRGIDPAHIADGSGRRFLHFSGGRMVELAVDGLSTRGDPRTVFQPWPIPRDWRVECVCLEAPKIFFRHGYYYLTVAEGGTAGPATSHMVISARSRNVDGPWEYSPHNPIVHTRSRSERWWSQGHGRLVDAPDGTWWMTCHAYENGYQTLGRQTLLLPVEWTKDGWFRISPGVSPDKPIRKPQGEGVAAGLLSDDFTASELGPQWQFWRGHDRAQYETGKGRLVMHAVGPAFAAGLIVSCVAPDHAYEIEVDLEVAGECDAGLLLFYDPERASGLRISPEGIGMLRVSHGSPASAIGVPARSAALRLVNDRHEVEGYYRLPGGPWQRAPRSWEVSGLHHNVLGGFHSLRPALYACSSGQATFRSFRYRAL